jgi:hypothetical protein
MVTDFHTNTYLISLIFLKLNIVLFRQVNNLILKVVVEPYAAQQHKPKEFREQEISLKARNANVRSEQASLLIPRSEETDIYCLKCFIPIFLPCIQIVYV